MNIKVCTVSNILNEEMKILNKINRETKYKI